jgi:phosphatidate cytidylyltransferase
VGEDFIQIITGVGVNYKQLGRRAAVTAVGIPLIVGCVLVGKEAFLVLLDIILVVSIWEVYTLALKKGYFPSRVLGVLSVLIISWDLHFNRGKNFPWIVLLVILSVLLVELFKGRENSIVNAAITIFGIFYISLLSTFILIRKMEVSSDDQRFGGVVVIMILVTIWICDTAAYFFGIRFGKRYLFKRVSPHKTWEGAIAGFIFSIGVAIGFGKAFVPELSFLDCTIIGIIVGLIGQLSDLVESLFKRDAGVKDSSNLIPGHGGMLDRFDSPMLVCPVITLFFHLKDFI